MTDYALGLSFVMAIMAGMTTVALMLLHVSYYYILGPLAGLAIMLPYVGVIFSTVPAVAVAFFQYDGRKALTVLIVYALLQFLEGNILTPLIVGGRVRLFPLTVMVAFIFWGLIWGIAGRHPGGPPDLRHQGRLRERAGPRGRRAPAGRAGPEHGGRREAADGDLESSTLAGAAVAADRPTLLD